VNSWSGLDREARSFPREKAQLPRISIWFISLPAHHVADRPIALAPQAATIESTVPAYEWVPRRNDRQSRSGLGFTPGQGRSPWPLQPGICDPDQAGQAGPPNLNQGRLRLMLTRLGSRSLSPSETAFFGQTPENRLGPWRFLASLLMCEFPMVLSPGQPARPQPACR